VRDWWPLVVKAWPQWRPTVRYMMETEAHVYALAVAASVLLAFYPFARVLLYICIHQLHSPAAANAVSMAIRDFFAGEQGEFMVRNVQAANTNIGITSVFLLFFTSNGVFEPMEVALNRAWGVKENRSYVKNQVISLALIFACGGLAVISLMLTAAPSQWASSGGWLGRVLGTLLFKLAAVPISILALFLVYWLLPNRKIDPRRVAHVAVIVGLILEGLKYVNLLIAPWLEDKFREDYGVAFMHSATLLVLSALTALIVLAGAHWTAEHGAEDPLADSAVKAPVEGAGSV
jgi:membrane protein